MIDAARKIRQTNAAECGFSTTWLAWIMLEQFSALHDLPLSTEANGAAGSTPCSTSTTRPAPAWCRR